MQSAYSTTSANWAGATRSVIKKALAGENWETTEHGFEKLWVFCPKSDIEDQRYKKLRLTDNIKNCLGFYQHVKDCL